jgi:hypothetical protein
MIISHLISLQLLVRFNRAKVEIVCLNVVAATHACAGFSVSHLAEFKFRLIYKLKNTPIRPDRPAAPSRLRKLNMIALPEISSKGRGARRVRARAAPERMEERRRRRGCSTTDGWHIQRMADSRHAPSAPKHHERMAFCACILFSAWSKTTD